MLQEIIAKIWGHVQLRDVSIQKKNLPESFRKMVLSDKKPMTQNEIEERYMIPPQLASFYFNAGPFFISLRDYRDKIVHFGHEINSIFVLDTGFAVNKNVDPFKSFNLWKEEDFYGTNLASLRPVLHHIMTKTLETCDEFVKAITSCVAFPPSIIPKHNIYTRGYHTGAFTNLCNTIEEKRWWI